MGSHEIPWDPTQYEFWWCHNDIAMNEFISTRDVCRELKLSEPALRHVLRRDQAPRPRLHESARVFLWTTEDVRALAHFLTSDAECTAKGGQSDGR